MFGVSLSTDEALCLLASDLHAMTLPKNLIASIAVSATNADSREVFLSIDLKLG